MIMAGASEQAVACWISFFAESGLGIDKWLGDIIGVTFFAVSMLISRLFFGNPKRNIKPLKILPIFAVMLAVSFSFSAIIKIKILSLIVLATSGIFVGIMWPSIYSLGGEIFKYGGTVMFSMMALGGDLGCTIGPTLVGIVADVSSIDTGILISAIFPLIMLAGLFYVSEHVRKNKQKNENIN
jgi:fucose permease